MKKWTETLTDKFDWGDWPLVRYSFSEAFRDDLERQADLDTVAWACAMVACGLAPELPDLRVEALDAPAAGRASRDRDAQGERCLILSGRGAGSHLDFWRLSSGVLEFDRFMGMRLVRSADPGTGSRPAAC